MFSPPHVMTIVIFASSINHPQHTTVECVYTLVFMQRSVHLSVLIMGPVPLQTHAAVQLDGLEAPVTQVRSCVSRVTKINTGSHIIM